MKKILPIVFIPGILCKKEIWSNQVKYFSNLTEVYVVDVFRGNSIQAMAEEISQLYEHFDLVGFSAGGYLAQEVAAKYQNKVNRLVLMNTSFGNAAIAQQDGRLQSIQVCEKQGNQAGAELFIAKLMSTYTPSDLFYSDLRSSLKSVDANIFYYQMKSIIDYIPYIPALDHIVCPTLVVSSLDDPFVAVSSYQNQIQQQSNLTLKVLNQGGHMLPISLANEVNELIAMHFEILQPEPLQQPKVGCYG